MESLSHTSRKLSNGNGNAFSSKNGLFSGQNKFGAPIFTQMEDYREIFGSSASSVPVLDLSGFDDPNEFRSSKPDYSTIFGGFQDDDRAVSYQELFAGVSPEKARVTSSRRQPSQDSEDLLDTSNQSTDVLKQYNMSYHKTIQKSKDGSNGTTHVTQLHDVPGFTTFIDEIKMASSQKADKTQKSSAINGRPEVKNSKKAYGLTSESAVNSKNVNNRGGSFSEDKLFNACDVDVKSYPPKFPSPSFMPSHSGNHKASFNGPVASNPGALKIDEELDVNSAAAASVAALKKAIEKAQESIRIAKESVGRKKEGLQSFSNKSFKDSLKVKGREATDKKVEGKCGRVDAASEVFDSVERENACNGGFKYDENIFVARKVIDEINGKISESARQCEGSPLSAPDLNESEKVSVSREVRDETTGRHQDEKSCEQEVRTSNETSEEQGFIMKVDAVEKSREVEVKEQKADVEVRLNELESDSLVDKGTENGLPSSKQEEQKVVEKPQVFYKLVNFVKNFGGFVETMEGGKKVSDEVKDDDYKMGVDEAHNSVEDENKMNDFQEMIENELKDRDYEERHDQASEQFEIWVEQEEVLEEKSIDKSENEEMIENELKDRDYEERHNQASEQLEIGEEQEEVLEEKSIDKSENENGLGKDCDHDVNGKNSEEVSQWVENELKKSDIRNETEKEDSHKERAIEKWLDEVHELEINEKGPPYVHNMEESEVRLQDDSQKGEEETELSEERDTDDEKDSEETDMEKCKWAGDDEVVKVDYIYKERESTTSGMDGNEKNWEIEIPQKVDYEEIFCRNFDGFNHDNNVEIYINNLETCQEANDGEFKEEEAEAVEVSNTVPEYEISEAAGRSSTEDDERDYEVKEVHNLTSLEEVKIVFPQEERKLFPKRAHWNLEGSHLPSIPKEEETVEIKDEDKKDKETEVKRVEKEKKRLKELDEATKRQREEREKERIAVDRAIREARERAYAEIQEKAAVEKETAEVRQRVKAEAREKSEKASAEAKIRAERAAVERATEEARQRALEKAMSQKTTTSEQFVAEKFSSASRDGGMRQAASRDLHGSNGTNSESAQRSRAKLESHNRIMERTAKALAEKEKRDLLAQREQAERFRLAETLDAEIKRWSSGKEGNLRALLSTLQYILGSNSGWQPVSLTEIITSNAVKKAYRKATLVVHPDKLQQRGATIQQKYICEKVFDLLKAAWNRFNSEEK